MVSPGTVVAALVVGVVITMLAAWLPGRRAAKIPPVAAMSSVHATATTKSLVVRNTIGALFAAAGIASSLYATTMSDGTVGAGPLGLGAGLLVIGVFVLTPLLSRPLIAAAGPVLRGFGISGKLARQNAVRNPRRTAATASALMIGLTLITGMTVIAGSAQQAVDKMATSALKADYIVSMANMNSLSPEVAGKLAEVDGVTATSGLGNSPSRIDGQDRVPDRRQRRDHRLTRPISRSTAASFRIGGRDVVVDDKTAKDHGWRTGSTFTAKFEDGKKSS